MAHLAAGYCDSSVKELRYWMSFILGSTASYLHSLLTVRILDSPFVFVQIVIIEMIVVIVRVFKEPCCLGYFFQEITTTHGLSCYRHGGGLAISLLLSPQNL